MLCLHFEGWFQCRLATNPDPTDEARGVSGYTFALAGEPDLDRIIRFQDPVARRSHSHPVGVSVRRVSHNGLMIEGHPLEGARVSLLDDPKFESRNLLLTRDRAGVGLIHPFHIEFLGEGIGIRRLDVLYPEDPSLPLHRIPEASLARRAPQLLNGMIKDPLRIAGATGIIDAVSWRRQKRVRLMQELTHIDQSTAGAALEKRIRELEVESAEDMRVMALSLVQTRAFALNGPAHVLSDAENMLGEIDIHAEWPIEFWMGAWDADALCGFIQGILSLPGKFV